MPSPASSRRSFLQTGITLPFLASPGLRGGTDRDDVAGHKALPTVLTATRWDPVQEPLRLGFMTDCQYSALSAAPRAKRQYLLSPQKLADAIKVINGFAPHLSFHLGDLIDRDHRSLSVVRPILATLNSPLVHLLGNHDFEVPQEKRENIWADYGLSAPYHELVLPGWRFLFLDGNQRALHRHAKGSSEYKALGAWLSQHAKDPSRKLGSTADYNGALGEEQLRWLGARLDEARQARQRVLLFCHYPVLPADPHTLWDADAVVALVARQPHVMAWINGHNHDGNYLCHNGIHFWNLRGMVDTNENSFALASLTEEALDVRGYGREPNRRLLWRRVQW